MPGGSPRLILVIVNDAPDASLKAGPAIGAGFALHESVLHVVLDDSVRFTRFCQERETVLCFVIGVGGLALQYRDKVTRPDVHALGLYRGWQGRRMAPPAAAS